MTRQLSKDVATRPGTYITVRGTVTPTGFVVDSTSSETTMPKTSCALKKLEPGCLYAVIPEALDLEYEGWAYTYADAKCCTYNNYNLGVESFLVICYAGYVTFGHVRHDVYHILTKQGPCYVSLSLNPDGSLRLGNDLEKLT